MSYVGIDYGHGLTNTDTANGIRYGVIAQNSVGQAWHDSAEADFGTPQCPSCQGDAIECSEVSDTYSRFPLIGCADYACDTCEITFDSEYAFSDEVQSRNFSGDGYELTTCLDNNIFVLKSPFYTFAQFCSPCVPGAGNLDNPMTDGAKTYCLGHDWFEDGKAPYAVYSVETDKEIA